MISKDDWRLRNDVKHLEGMSVNPTDGEAITLHMEDNRECTFCWRKVSDNPHEHWYVTEDVGSCVCEDCFQDFKDMFCFRLLDGWDIEWEK